MADAGARARASSRLRRRLHPFVLPAVLQQLGALALGEERPGSCTALR